MNYDSLVGGEGIRGAERGAAAGGGRKKGERRAAVQRGTEGRKGREGQKRLEGRQGKRGFNVKCLSSLQPSPLSRPENERCPLPRLTVASNYQI